MGVIQFEIVRTMYHTGMHTSSPEHHFTTYYVYSTVYRKLNLVRASDENTKVLSLFFCSHEKSKIPFSYMLYAYSVKDVMYSSAKIVQLPMKTM